MRKVHVQNHSAAHQTRPRFAWFVERRRARVEFSARIWHLGEKLEPIWHRARRLLLNLDPGTGTNAVRVVLRPAGNVQLAPPATLHGMEMHCNEWCRVRESSVDDFGTTRVLSIKSFCLGKAGSLSAAFEINKFNLCPPGTGFWLCGWMVCRIWCTVCTVWVSLLMIRTLW